MTYFRACFIASLALLAFACQSSSPQEATPAPAVEKGEAARGEGSTTAPPTEPEARREEASTDEPEVNEEVLPLTTPFLDDDVVLPPKSEERQRLDGEVKAYLNYATHDVPILTPEQWRDHEKLSTEQHSIARRKLFRVLQGMQLDGKSPEEIAAHMRARGAWAKVDPPFLKYGFSEDDHDRTITEEGYR